MQKYINQLTEDIEQTILHRWTKCPPHFFGLDIGNPYLKPPKGLEGYKQQKPDYDETNISKKSKKMIEDLEFGKIIAEVESYVEGGGTHNMFYYFGFSAAQFPPADRLSDALLNKLTLSILRLWETFNYSAVFPKDTPAPILYPLLTRQMHKPTLLLEKGQMGIEFCHYDPDDCPFGVYCDCK